MKKFKLIRLLVFIIATIALANFFEAGRLISSELTFEHFSTSIGSLFIVLIAIFIMGYWVYEEEKNKNNLRIKFTVYELIYKVLNKQKGVNEQK